MSTWPLPQGRCVDGAPTLRIPSCAGEYPSPLTSANTRLTEPRETQGHGPSNVNTRNQNIGRSVKERDTSRLDTASRLHTSRHQRLPRPRSPTPTPPCPGHHVPSPAHRPRLEPAGTAPPTPHAASRATACAPTEELAAWVGHATRPACSRRGRRGQSTEAARETACHDDPCTFP